MVTTVARLARLLPALVAFLEAIVQELTTHPPEARG